MLYEEALLVRSSPALRTLGNLFIDLYFYMDVVHTLPVLVQ
jgi:hypothetical protein